MLNIMKCLHTLEIAHEEMHIVSQRVGVLTLSDAAETSDNNAISSARENLDDKAPCIPKVLTGLFLGQMVMLVAAAATLGAVVSDNVRSS